jgi:glycosyltransferase involved in cell wall biosynthesis
VLSPYRWLPLYLFSLPLLLWRKRFDVVQCHLMASNWLGKPLAKLFRVPLVISHDHSHEFRFAWPLAVGLDRWTNSFADRVFVISKPLLEKLRTVERIPEGKLIYLPNGVAVAQSQTRRSACRQRRIGAAGRLVDWKNFDRFLRLAQQLALIDNQYRFLIAGDGPELVSLRRLANQLGIRDKLTWRGTLPSLAPFFEDIDLFVLTSDWEELPMVVLEAFAAEVPTAIVCVNPVRLARHREALCLDPETDEVVWASKIDALLGQPDRLAEIARNARTLVERQFSAQAQVKAMEKIYEDALTRISRAP